MEKPMKSPKIPQMDSIEKLARFWDTHDLTDFEAQLEEITAPIFKRREETWVQSFINEVNSRLVENDSRLQAVAGERLLYAYEALYYRDDIRPEPAAHHMENYETDILVLETATNRWKPRVVVEAKLKSVTTHDAITYSQKSATHKQVHPYLRYGILLGNRKHHPLPGRLFRHGSHFDFMVSWMSDEPSTDEFNSFINLLLEEVAASRLLEEIIYESRSRTRNRYSMLQKRLVLR
jgi:hypothetical protein